MQIHTAGQTRRRLGLGYHPPEATLWCREPEQSVSQSPARAQSRGRQSRGTRQSAEAAAGGSTAAACPNFLTDKYCLLRTQPCLVGCEARLIL